MEVEHKFPLLDLPEELVKLVLSFCSVRDVASFSLTCKKSLRFSREVELWKLRLYRDRGLAIVAVPSPHSHHSVYKQLRAEAQLQHIRFQAMYTDGGVDEGVSVFGVDNMFVPILWDAHCTEKGENVTCFGILSDLFPVNDAFVAENVQLLQTVLGFAHALGRQGRLGVPPHEFFLPLQDWSRAQLMRFYRFLRDHLPQRIFFHGCMSAADVEKRTAELRRLEHGLTVPTVLPGQWVTVRNNKHTLVDTARVRLLVDCPAAAPTAVAALERITVSRQGAWTCPIRTGAVALALVQPGREEGGEGPPRRAPPQPEATEAAADAAEALETDATRLLGTCKRLSQVVVASRDGQLPPIRSLRRCGQDELPAGIAVEFAPPPFESAHVLWPVVWFQFYNREERAAALQQPEPEEVTSALNPRPPETSEEAVGGESEAGPSRDEDVAQRLAGTQRGGCPYRARAADPEDAEARLEAQVASMLRRMAQEDTGTAAPANTGRGEWCEELPLPEVEAPDADAPNAETDLAREAMGRAGAPSAEALDTSEDESDDDSDEDSAERQVQESQSGITTLRIPLQQHRAGNLVCVKLIDQENRMRELHDPHPEPNIDIVYLGLYGREMRLPVGTRLTARVSSTGLQE